MKKIKTIDIGAGVPQTVDDKLEVLRLKINEIIEELNSRKE